MSGSTIDASIVTSVTLGSPSYLSPLTITAAGTIAPASASGAGAFGVYVPGAFTGSVLNDGLILGGLGAYEAAAGGGILLSIGSTLALGGLGTIHAANGYGANGGADGGTGGIGVELMAGASFVNGALGSSGNTIIGGIGGDASDHVAGNSGDGGVGIQLDTSATALNFGLIIGGAGGYGNLHGGDGAAGAVLGTLSSLDNEGTIIAGYGGASATLCGTGGVGALVTATASLSNSGSIGGGNGSSNGFQVSSGGTGLAVDAGGYASNALSGTITGGNGGGGGGAGTTAGLGGVGVVIASSYSSGSGFTLIGEGKAYINLGSVGGGGGGYGGPTGYGGTGGVGLELDPGVTMANAGTISGGTGGTGGLSGGAGGAGVVLSSYNAFTNTGLIAGGSGGLGTVSQGGIGLSIGHYDTATTSGTIIGGNGESSGGFGVLIDGNAVLIADGTISGGLSGVLRADAVSFGQTGGTLEVEAGAVFNGAVAAVAGAGDVLELGGSSPGTLAGIGTAFTGFDTLSFLAGADWTAEGSTTGLTGFTGIGGFTASDAIILDGFTATSESFVSGTGLEVSDGITTLTLAIDGGFSTSSFLVTDVAAGTEIQLLCFLQGTRILTPTGEMPIEDLAVGDVVMTRFSGMQRIKWIGRQSHSAALARVDAAKRPVCIKAGALAEGVPARDLYVSPGHSMLVEGNLLLAGLLVNGVTVTQDWCPEVVEYYQIELEAHDCVVAEGAFAETYADCGAMRGQFGNAAEFHALYPGYRPPEEPGLCAPRPEKGARLEAALRHVLARVAKAPGPLQGWLDRISAPWSVEGWARDEAAPACPVLLEFLLDGELLGTALACHFRADLMQAGYGTGRCGFSWTAPRDLPADAAARLHIRRAGDNAWLPQ